MNWTDLLLRLKALLHRERAEADLDDELSFHLAMEARKRRAAGLDDERAQQQARLVFGGTEQVKESCRDQRGTRWLEELAQDLAFAARLLRKDRSYAVAAIVALALGIGVNTALFTVFRGAVMRPLQAGEPERVVSLWRVSPEVPRGGYFSFSDYLYYRDHASAFASLAAETPGHQRLTAASLGVAEPVMGLFVTANYFATFGMRPVAGHDFAPEDDYRTAGPFPVVMSENYWERRFQRDPSLVGRNVMLTGTPVTIIGIAPRDFMGTRPDVPDFWIIASAMGDPQARAADRHAISCALTGRLRRGATLAQARAQVDTLAAALRQQYPTSERRWSVQTTQAVRFGPAHDIFVILFLLLQVAMGLVLLIACSNVAGLMLGRAAVRQREISVRLSLGASRGRLVRQLVTEGVLLALLAGGVAFGVSWQMLTLIGRRLSEIVPGDGGTIALDTAPDLQVFAYILGLSTLAGIAFALLPALQSTRPDLASALKEDGAGFGIRRKARLRGWMVATQIAVCLTLLTGAGLLAGNSLRLLSVDPGFDTRAVLALTLANPEEFGESAARAQDLRTRLAERLPHVPGVLSFAYANRVPLGGNVSATMVRPVEAKPTPDGDGPPVPFTYVSERFLDTFAIALVRGRGFTSREIATQAPVVVISEALAQRLWPGQDPLGRRVALGSQEETHFAWQQGPVSAASEVIGVARDIHSVDFTAPDRGAVYVPQPAAPWNRYAFARVAGDPPTVAAALLHEIRGIAPNLPVTVRGMRDVIGASETSVAFRLGAAVFSIIGLLGFALATVGVSSMVSYSVSRQTREVGIRMALGARGRDVVWALLRSAMGWICGGLAAGCVLGLAMARLLAAKWSLVGSGVVDPLVVLAIGMLTGVLSVVAAWLPARRATRLDPATTLRFE